MPGSLLRKESPAPAGNADTLGLLLREIDPPFGSGQTVGIKLHWGERGNGTFLPACLAKEIVGWLQELGAFPFVFDTTVLYSGGRRTGKDALDTAAAHGYSAAYLGCPVVIADGLDGRDVLDIPAGFKHFPSVQVASLIRRTAGFVVFSHFKGHLEAVFGGALKNISMGFASRAQKQRIHADAYPELRTEDCRRCGDCVALCPVGAARFAGDYPSYSRELCIGCAQCIALCPQSALRILWGEDHEAFLEKLVETAAAVWRIIGKRTVLINALLNIASECDCLTGDHPFIAPDFGFVAGDHPLAVDRESLRIVGSAPFVREHPHIPWERQFSYAEEIGFYPER